MTQERWEGQAGLSLETRGLVGRLRLTRHDQQDSSKCRECWRHMGLVLLLPLTV